MNWKHRIIAVLGAFIVLGIVGYILWSLEDVSVTVRVIIFLVSIAILQRLQDKYIKNVAERQKVHSVGKFYIKTYSEVLKYLHNHLKDFDFDAGFCMMHYENFPNANQIVSKFSSYKRNASENPIVFFNEFDNILSNLQPITTEKISDMVRQLEKRTQKGNDSMELSIVEDLIDISVCFLNYYYKNIPLEKKTNGTTSDAIGIMVQNMRLGMCVYSDCVKNAPHLVETKKDCILGSIYVATYDLFEIQNKRIITKKNNNID
jgi:hypothetical protein